MSIVGAFKAWEHHFPPCDDDDDREIQSRMKDFVAKVIDEIRPQNRQRKEVVEQPRGYALVLIGKRVVQEGKHEGKQEERLEEGRQEEGKQEGKQEEGKQEARAPSSSRRCPTAAPSRSPGPVLHRARSLAASRLLPPTGENPNGQPPARGRAECASSPCTVLTSLALR